MNTHTIKSLTIALFLCLLAAGHSQAQVQMTVKSFNSLRPAKADVEAIDEGIVEVRKKVDAKGSATEIQKNINWLNIKVNDVRKDFPKFKRIQEWEADIEKLQADQAQLKANEEAAYQAKTKKDAAISKVSNSLYKTGIERDITDYRANPTASKGNEVAEGYAYLVQSLEDFRKEYPSETESEVIRRANEAEAYVKGEFMPSYLSNLKEAREKDDRTIAEKRQATPDAAIRILEGRTAQGNKLVAAFPEVATFADYQAKDKALLKEINSYKTDGGFEQYKMDQVVIEPSAGSDAYVENDIKKILQKEGYEVLVVNMRDDRWVLVKNEFDLPKYQEKDAVLGLRKDGHCYRMFGSYRRDYAGAGTYMEQGYFRWNDPVKMNCSNCK